jgi:hypothetical protein
VGETPSRGGPAQAGESALEVAAGTDELIACVTRAQPSTPSCSTAQAKLDLCRQRLQDGTYQDLPQALRTYLVERLTQDAAERHINAGSRNAGSRASQEFQALPDRRLTRPEGAAARSSRSAPAN